MNRDNLEGMLEALAPQDDRETSYKERMLCLVQGRDDPFSRDRFEPGHFTASAFVLDPTLRSIVLIHHQKLQRWLQPGGHLDPLDRDIVESARREVREEIGLDGMKLHVEGTILDVDIHAIPRYREDPAHEHFDVRFLFEAGGQELRAGSDANAARWVRLEEVSADAADESVMRAVRKIRALV